MDIPPSEPTLMQRHHPATPLAALLQLRSVAADLRLVMRCVVRSYNAIKRCSSLQLTMDIGSFCECVIPLILP
jgi:hypothetical protein